nr:hypothetical protein CFP56_75114 [Quercus suber]
MRLLRTVASRRRARADELVTLRTVSCQRIFVSLNMHLKGCSYDTDEAEVVLSKSGFLIIPRRRVQETWKLMPAHRWKMHTRPSPLAAPPS